MKKLGFRDTSVRNRLAARPSSDVAAVPLKPNGLGTSTKAVSQWRELRLPPWAALAAILAAIAVALCEPAGLLGWIKALAAGCIVPGGAYAIVKTATGQWRVE
jgi:hypothetical protein